MAYSGTSWMESWKSRHVRFQAPLDVRLVILFLLFLVPTLCDLTTKEGHHQPFGHGRPIHSIDEVEGFPDSETFFKNYVYASKPLKMTNAAKISPAFHLWSDKYLSSVDIPSEVDSMVTVETKKKENRTQAVISVEFKEFLKMYNNSDFYMVHDVPPFIRKDVVLPCPIQCEDMVNKDLVTTMMWFSSGGTKSVMHTDSVDNINCLYRGDKQLVMVDPHKYGEYVDLDHPEGAYADIDVDKVDYTKYPGLAQVEYYHVNVTAGDCLFIPYLWIHQVRSFGSNLAVNLWWDHYKGLNLSLTRCNPKCDPLMTLDTVTFQGFDENPEIGTIIDQVVGFTKKKGSFGAEDLLKFLIGTQIQREDFPDATVFDNVIKLMEEVVAVLDSDRNGEVSLEETEAASEEAWMEVRDLVVEMEEMKEDIQRATQSGEMDEQEVPPDGWDGTSTEGDNSVQDPLQRDEL